MPEIKNIASQILKRKLKFYLAYLSIVVLVITATTALSTSIIYAQTANLWNISRNTSTNDLDFYLTSNGPTGSSLQLKSNGTTKIRNIYDLDDSTNTYFLDPNSSSRLNSLSVDKLGIGAAPSSNFEIWGGSSPNALVTFGVSGGAGTDKIFRILSDTPNAETLTFTRDGNLGLGITNPTQKLEVNGPAVIGTSTLGRLNIRSLDANTVTLRPSVANGDILISDDSGIAARGTTFGNGGSVGIRTGTPTSDLHIKQFSNGQYNGGITLERSDTGNRAAFIIGGDNRLYMFSGSGYATVSDTGYLTSSGGGAFSSKSLKENYSTIDNNEILEKIDKLPIMKWNYINSKGSNTHIGPFAEDFYEAFGLNQDEKDTISYSDETGVALAGVKALSEKVKKQQEEIDMLKKEIENLKR